MEAAAGGAHLLESRGMRRRGSKPRLAASALILAAVSASFGCSLLVDTNSLTGGAAPGGSGAPDGGRDVDNPQTVDDAGTQRSETPDADADADAGGPVNGSDAAPTSDASGAGGEGDAAGTGSGDAAIDTAAPPGNGEGGSPTDGSDGSATDVVDAGVPFDAGVSVAQVTGVLPTVAASVANVTLPTTHAGSVIVVAVGWQKPSASSGNVTNVSNDTGDTFVLAAGPTSTPSGLSHSVYYVQNGSSGQNAIHVDFDTPVNPLDVMVVEYLGLAQTSPFESAAASSGTSAVASSGTAPTLSPEDLILGAGIASDAVAGLGPMFTLRDSSKSHHLLEDRIAVAPGAYAASASLASATDWVMQVVAFRTAAAASLQP
jgi:hypothetical protein